MASGIDTESIVTKLMAIERQPQDQMKTRITALQRAQTAWAAIADKLTAMKTAAEAVSGLNSAAALRSVTSSNPTAVAVRATGSGTDVSSNIRVTGLAAAKAVLAGDLFTAATDSVGARTLDITTSTGTTTITSTDGTVGGLASAINAANLGVSARIIQTSPGSFQLSMTATKSGTANAFTASGTGWASLDTVRDAANAQLVVDGVTVTRSSNVINDVLDGIELTLTSQTTSDVTVTSTRDDAAITAKIKAFVDAANALTSGIALATKTSTDAAQRGPLAGDYQARRISDSIRNAIAQPLVAADGSTTTASALGVSLQRDGTITFDASKLSATLATNPSTVLAVIGRSASSTAAGVKVAGATSAATTSSRAITVTQTASQATLVGLVTPPPPAGTQVTMNVVTPEGTFNVSFLTGGSSAETAGNLNAALRAAGARLVAVTQPGGSIDLKDERAGTGHVFTVTGGDAIGLSGTAADGTNAAGTIDGVAFTANGRSFATGGLVLDIGTTATQLAAGGGTVSGTISVASGLAGALSSIGAQGGASGPAMASKATLQDRIDDLQKRVDRYDDTLKLREQVIRAKFTAMETMIDKLQTMLTPLGSLTTSSSS